MEAKGKGLSTRYTIPAGAVSTQIVVENSRFIADLGPAFSVEEARGFITRVKGTYPDASHHVPAFVIGHGVSVIEHCHDAGEPSGTAGRPVLAVLKGSGLGDAVLVVTRYFGGIKLGTGGLVRAYTEAAKAVVEIVQRAEKIPTHTVMVAIPYNLFERVRLLAGQHRGQILDEDFGADVTVTIRFAKERLAGFQGGLSEMTRGEIQGDIVESNPETIVPVGEY